MMAPDADLTRKEIAKFSARDAERYRWYEAMLERVAALVEPTLTLAPLDLERVFNLTGGNIFQGAMHSRSALRLPSCARLHALPDAVRGLYLCGAAAHPGGGVMGTPGLNAAREILGRRRLRARQGSRRAKTRRLLERS